MQRSHSIFMCAGAVAIVMASCVQAQTQVMTQSVDQTTITLLNSVSCNDGAGHHTDNGYFRSYSLGVQGISRDIIVTAVRFAVEESTPGPGFANQPVEVRLYTDPTPASPPSPVSSLNLLHTEMSTLALGTQIFAVVPITTQVLILASETLVVEVFTPNGQLEQHIFFFGTNAGGETAPGYLQAIDCMINEPTEPSAIGFPTMHMILDVEYTEIVPPTCTLTGPGGTASGQVSMDVDAQSVIAPTVDLLFEYSLDGGATYSPCTRSLVSLTPNPAIGVPTGITNFVWDSVADGVGTSSTAAVTLRATVDDGYSATTGECTDTLSVDNQASITPCTGTCGDCNGDAVGPNILDALVAARIAAGATVPTMMQQGCCDVNSTGLIEVLDALLMAQTGAGLPATINCP